MRNAAVDKGGCRYWGLGVNWAGILRVVGFIITSEQLGDGPHGDKCCTIGLHLSKTAKAQVSSQISYYPGSSCSRSRNYTADAAGIHIGEGPAFGTSMVVGKLENLKIEDISPMRILIILQRLCLLFAMANAQEHEVDKCPKDEIACHDVMNGSQCLAQIVMDNNPPISADALVKCVQHEGTASNLPGATKVFPSQPQPLLQNENADRCPETALPVSWVSYSGTQRGDSKVLSGTVQLGAFVCKKGRGSSRGSRGSSRKGEPESEGGRIYVTTNTLDRKDNHLSSSLLLTVGLEYRYL